MARAAVRQAIEERLANNWTATPIAMDNVYFSPPANSPFIRLTIIMGTENQVSMLNGYRLSGFIDVGIFAPEGTGTAASYTYADNICTLFRGQEFSGVTCRGATTTRIPSADKGWLQLNVSIPFFYNTIY